MPIDNPYQSPQTKSALEPSVIASERIYAPFPTWRFWSLSLFGALTAFALWLFLVKSEGLKSNQQVIIATRIATDAAALTWAVSSLAILITWRSPARFDGSRLRKIGVTALSLAIVLLGILDCLAVAALFIALFLPSLNQKDGARAIAGLALGVFALIICAIVVRDLWLDAMGRTKKITRDA